MVSSQLGIPDQGKQLVIKEITEISNDSIELE